MRPTEKAALFRVPEALRPLPAGRAVPRSGHRASGGAAFEALYREMRKVPFQKDVPCDRIA